MITSSFTSIPGKPHKRRLAVQLLTDFLSLSLLSYLNEQTAVVPENLVMGINYGSDKVRYLMPVRVGKRIRSHQKVLEVTEKKPGQWLIKNAVTVEIEGEETPALVAEILSMMVIG